MENLESLRGTNCVECPRPPPEFRLPPPPRPPFLTKGTFCSEALFPELEECIGIPIIDTSHHPGRSLQSTSFIITSTMVFFLMAAVPAVFWRHKKKARNLLPGNKSAVRAATASATQQRLSNNGRNSTSDNLSNNSSSAILYEDLPEPIIHPQLHSHHSNYLPVQSTIEIVRPTTIIEQQEQHLQSTHQPPYTPATHNFDYLDYRDPRSILRVAIKPSRSVLGGYRTSQTLLASESQEFQSSTSSSHLITRSTLDSNQASPSNDQRMITNNNINPGIFLAPRNFLSSSTPKFNVPVVNTSSTHKFRTSSTPSSQISKLKRVPSVDSEGYSYIDFREDSSSQEVRKNSLRTRKALHKLISSSEYSTIDSEGYSTIESIHRRVPSSYTERPMSIGTEQEEVCPLCTMHQIHDLLSEPENIYLEIQDT